MWRHAEFLCHRVNIVQPVEQEWFSLFHSNFQNLELQQEVAFHLVRESWLQKSGKSLIFSKPVNESLSMSLVGASDSCPLTLDFSSLAQVQLCSSADVYTGCASALFFTQMFSVLQQVQAVPSYEDLRTCMPHSQS